MYSPQYKACPNCQTAAELSASHCSRCGQMFQGQPAPPPYGAQQYAPGVYQVQASQKVPAGICGIILGGLGVHKFILGYTTEGIIMLLTSLLTCGLAYPVMHVIGIVEGIIYLSKTDADFVNTYVVQKKGWF
jgi:TM2 domain-containing membrane protein YozV